METNHPRFNDERAPLEFTRPSKRQRMLVCPNCRSGRMASVDTVGVVCSGCNTYFSTSDSLPPDQVKTRTDTRTAMEPETKKFREGMEERAYDYRDKVMNGGASGSHEPEDVERIAERMRKDGKLQ